MDMLALAINIFTFNNAIAVSIMGNTLANTLTHA